MALTLETRQSNKNTAGTSVSAVYGNNNGGLLGGSAYLNEKMALGFLSSVEGIWDYTAGGIAKLFGADQWAERQFVNDWVNYNHADEWFDPGKGWQIAGDVAGGIGTSLPAIAAAGGAAALTLATGGAAAPAAVKILSASVAPLVAGLGAAGNATKSAYQKTGELGLKEFGYGALSGATEAAIEGLTAGIGTGTGRIVSSLSKRAAGETVSTLGKSGAFALLKTLGADFASEAIEEGLAEAVDPLYQRWTKVDPNAQNASAKEIGYAALVGGLSGIVMSGGAAAVNTTANLFSGDSSIKSGTSGAILDTARQISEYESANDTGYKSFQTIRDAYSQLSASLAGTGGQVSTVKQKMLLGSLKQAETAAFVEPFIERSAMSLLTSSESAAERFSALGMTDANGKPLTFTAEQIRSGVDADLITKLSTGKLTDTERRTLTKQVRKAIGTNSVLTTLAVMDATGRISMDTEKFAQAALSGRQIATAADLNRFIETASPAQIENLSKKLKIDNWAALTPDVFQSRVAEFNATEEGQAYRAQMEFVKQAQTIADSESKKLPRLFRSNTVAQGLTHYASADGRVNMALLREGDRYHLYDYETGNPSRDLTLAEVNSAIRPYWNAQGNAQSTAQTAQDAQKPVAVQTEGVSTETPTESATAAQTVRLNMIAAENITDWRGMSEPNRAAVRMTMRQALAAGMDEDTALTFGRVAARSGMNIVFSAEQSGDGDARITGNTIYIDPNADKGRMENKLLLHEAGHALMRERDGARLIARAFQVVSPEKSAEIAQRYQKFYQQRGMRMDQYLPIIDEEIAAAGIEDTLGNIDAWEYILSEEPSFGDKILNFFRGAARDYSTNEGLSSEARKLLLSYRKMFNELSERNRGNNAITLANEVEYGRQDVDYEQISKGRKNQRVHGERFALKEISDVVDKALANQGEIGEKYNQRQISEVPENVADLVSKASGGKIDISNKMIALNGDDIWHEYRSHGDEIKERGKKQIPLTPSDIKAAVGAIYDPDVVESVFSDINNPTQRQSFAYAKKSPDGHYVVVEAIGGKRNPNIIPVMILQFSEEKWNDMLNDGITLGELFHENDPKKKNALDIDFNKKNRVTVARSTSNEVIASFPRSPRFNESIADSEPKVNSKSKKSSDERLALPEDGKKKKKYHMSHGQLRADVANKTRKKAYSKADARATLEGFTGADLLTKKVQNELADYMWQGFNTCETKEQRETFAKNFAQEIGKKLFLVQDEAPDAAMYRERLTYLRSGIGKLAITSGDYAGDFRHVLDKDGYASFRARWSFGAKAGKQGFRPYSVENFVNDIAGEMPGMAYLQEMTPADAMLEIDRLYTEAKAGAKEEVDVYTEEEANAVIGGFEAQILKAFDERGHLSVFQKRVGYLLEQYSQMAEDAKAKYDEVVGRDKILGRIDSLAQKMKDLKMGTFANATQMDSDIFVGSIHKLAGIEYRRNLSVTKAKNALRELATWYTQEQKPLMYVDEQNPGYYNKGVSEMLRALTETDDPFTKDQLAMLQDVMSYFVKFVENYGKVWRGGKWIDAKPEAERYVAQIVKNADIKTTTFDRMMRTRYINSFGDPHAVVKQYDGYDDGFCTEMFEEIRKAALDADVQLMNVMSDYDAFMKKNPKYMKQAAKQQIRWVEDGRTNTMPKMVAIGLYMTSKREHAQAGLALNGFKFKDRDGNIIKAGALIRNADPKEVTQAQISEAISELQSRIRKQLSAEDLEYIKILEKGYGYDLRALKAERDMARQGFTNVTMGYYYPIRRADIAKSIDTSVFSELDRVSNASFNKSIVQGARGKLFIEDADALFHRHAVAVTRYSSLSPVIESFNILFNMDTSGNPNNSVSVATTIEAQWPKAKEYFRDLIADVQGVAKNLGEYSDTLATLRSYVAMSQLGANPKTWVTQFSSLFAASSMLDPASIRKGLAHVSDDVDNYCDLAKLRNYEGAAIKAQGVLDKVSSVGELLMKPIAATDRLVVKCLWGACQVQVQKDSKLKIGTEENKIAAGKMLTDVLFETQQNSLATERSAMMRSGNELIRALTMFSADGMKVTGRFLDGIGEVSVLKRRLETANADEKPAIEKKLKAAKKRSRKATAAMISSAVFAVMIAEAFRWLYAKEREEDENAWADMSADFVGNLLGGLPGLRDVYSFFIDGYELDNYAISAVNDLLTSVKSTTTLAWDLVRGEGDPKDIPAKVKNLAYAAGQFTGIPVRNIYNVLTGLTRRISPNAGYLVDNVFYQKNYRTDLKKAIEEGDMRRVSLLMGLINGKDESGLIGDEGMSELSRLAASGASVLPRTIGKTVSINGEEVDLDTSQVQMINEAYNESWSASLASLLASSAYASMNDAQKEKAIRMVHDISYERALVSAGIDRGEKSVLIADLIGIERAAVYYSLTSGIASDVDRNGKTVEGSKRAKVVSAIRSMNLGRERTLLMICLAGYSLKDGDVRGMKAKSEKVLLLKYIMQLPGKSAAQKAVIAQACGFEVRNGRVLMSSLNGD